MSTPRLTVLLPLLALCIASRVPAFRASVDPQVGWYLWNFSPLLGLVLFGGAMYRGWFWRTIPIAAYLLGDVAVWIASGDVSNAFHPISLWSYAGLLAVLVCGAWLRNGGHSWGRVGVAAVSGAVLFFLITNFGSWSMDPWLPTPTGYARSLDGLAASYLAAIPFARGDLASLLLFSALFFSPIGLRLLTRQDALSADAAGDVARRAGSVQPAA
ncbi:MAG: DUF6580 family putative transport protein [Planctomycetaceae bacterium]